MTVAAARVGLLALQGGVAEHRRLLEALDAAVVPIRRPADLIGPDGSRIDALVLPGGESSTIDRLARLFELTQPLSDLIEAGLPTLGTCAGLIMLASEIADQIEGVSDRMLSERLKEFEAEGVIERRVYPETPVRIEYRLTEKGQALDAVLDAIATWSHEWVEAAPARLRPPTCHSGATPGFVVEAGHLTACAEVHSHARRRTHHETGRPPLLPHTRRGS